MLSNGKNTVLWIGVSRGRSRDASWPNIRCSPEPWYRGNTYIMNNITLWGDAMVLRGIGRYESSDYQHATICQLLLHPVGIPGCTAC